MGCMLLAVLVFAGIYKFIPIVYFTNDDRMIMEIVSGQFTGNPESYAIQMTYGMTWFLSKLYEMTDAFNWYGIVMIGLQMFAFGSVLYRLQSLCVSINKKILILSASVLAYLMLWVNVFVQLTYTTTAAFVGAAAIFWYAMSKDNPKNVFTTGLLANLAFCVRPNVFYMLLPAAGILWLFKITEKRKKSWLVYAAPFMMLAVTACLFCVDYTANQRSDWKEFREFFDDRTQIYDYYDLLPYEEHPELYEPYGISEEEYNLIRIYDYTILGDIPKEFFPNYIKAYEQMEKTEGITAVTRSTRAVKQFISDVAHGSYGLENTVLFLSAALFFAWVVYKKHYRLANYLVVQSVVCNVLWLYFTYWERAIERIQIAMSLIFLAVILQVFCQMVRPKFTRKQLKWMGLAAVAVMLGLAGRNLTQTRLYNIQKAHEYQDILAIKEFCAENPEETFFMDVASITEQFGNCTIGSQDPEYMNYIPLGDWSAYCPHYETKLKLHGVDNVKEALTADNSYVIILNAYQLQCIMDYLGEDYDAGWTRTIFGPSGDTYAVYEIRAVED